MTKLKRILVGVATALVLANHSPASAEKVLRWASADGVLTWDPHGARILTTYWGLANVYEPLVNYDVHLRFGPRLAVEWRLVDGATWRFELREGVTFHDGAPLGAEDVVFSIDRARAETSDLFDLLSARLKPIG